MTQRLEHFETRLKEGVCSGDTGGGVYKVLNSNGIVRTKQVRTYEYKLRGKTLINPNRHLTDNATDYDSNRSETSRSTATVEKTSSDSDNMHSEGQYRLTYVPPQPSTFGEYDGNTHDYSN